MDRSGIFTVYSNKKLDKIKITLTEIIEIGGEYNLIVGGDLNARIGEKGELVGEDQE